MKTIQEQRQERRQAKLNHIQRQIKSGRLVVRQMTAEERGDRPVLSPQVETPEPVQPR
jgi:hypothetical protein